MFLFAIFNYGSSSLTYPKHIQNIPMGVETLKLEASYSTVHWRKAHVEQAREKLCHFIPAIDLYSPLLKVASDSPIQEETAPCP